MSHLSGSGVTLVPFSGLAVLCIRIPVQYIPFHTDSQVRQVRQTDRQTGKTEQRSNRQMVRRAKCRTGNKLDRQEFGQIKGLTGNILDRQKVGQVHGLTGKSLDRQKIVQVKGLTCRRLVRQKA